MKISYTQGGVQSGFKHVEKGYKDPRLYQIKDAAGGIRVDLVSLDRVLYLQDKGGNYSEIFDKDG
jgi:hypothetical protein